MTIVASEIDRFNRLSASWWNSSRPMRPLHVVDELRLEYIRRLMAQQFTCAEPSNLAGLRVLDVGCGAGLLCEPIAQSGAQVTGMDAAARDVAADVKAGPLKSVEGKPLTLTTSPMGVKVNDANVIKTDLMASNGVIHVIDTVVVPN